MQGLLSGVVLVAAFAAVAATAGFAAVRLQRAAPGRGPVGQDTAEGQAGDTGEAGTTDEASQAGSA